MVELVMTNDNLSVTKLATNLLPGDVLVGEAGGRSAIFGLTPSSKLPGLLVVDTEHGSLYLDPDKEYEVELQE